MTLRTAVVGAGVVSSQHLSGLEQNPLVDLVAVCDLDEVLAREKAREYGIKAYFDVDELLKAEQLDWIHLCTPVQTHRDLALTAIEHGVDVQIEKPATVTVEELEEIEAAADERDVTVTVVRNHLFSISVREARERIEAGDLGAIRGVDVIATGKTAPDEQNRGAWAFELPGGEFQEGIPHQIYVALGLGGYPRSSDDVHATTSRFGEYDEGFTFDGLQLQWVTDDDVLCSVKLMAGAVPKRELLIHGEEKSLVIDLLSETTIELDRDYAASPVARGLSNVDHALGRFEGSLDHAKGMVERRFSSDWETEKHWDSHFYQFHEEAEALLTDDEPPFSLEQAKWTIELIELVEKASEVRDERPVASPPTKSTPSRSVTD